nr:MAG TPA: hypothetical protein [Caudoviricetes sp.]
MRLVTNLKHNRSDESLRIKTKHAEGVSAEKQQTPQRAVVRNCHYKARRFTT